MSVTAVLWSGGLDSAVLAAEEAARAEIQPIYVSVGLAWEDAERAMLSRLLAADRFRAHVRPLVALTVDMRDVYAATHWAVQGTPPAYHTPDEDVYLPGRNVILLGKAGVFCAAARIDRLVLGTLGHNPFPDATPAFRSAMAEALSLGLLTAAAAAQGPSNVDEVLGHVATRVEEYFARAQKVVFVEKTMIQYVRTDLTPQGFARVLEADLRVESDPADGDGSSEAKVVRELRKVNGHRPRTKDDQDCLDPNPISPEPLAFLLPAQRSKYAFTLAGRGKGKDKNTVMVDFRELGTGKPEVKERSDKAEGCFSIDLPGRGRGRVWLDAST